jgi:hypothetical protein
MRCLCCGTDTSVRVSSIKGLFRDPLCDGCFLWAYNLIWREKEENG